VKKRKLKAMFQDTRYTIQERKGKKCPPKKDKKNEEKVTLKEMLIFQFEAISMMTCTIVRSLKQNKKRKTRCQPTRSRLSSTKTLKRKRRKKKIKNANSYRSHLLQNPQTKTKKTAKKRKAGMKTKAQT
jgi:hypothetical protein